ncbi:MAG: RsmB/NOP family class I SAM-dependent RNA methyltransferase [Lachnospiraceae bacterium]|nr:RsmB/NOP family class I SAM-dependent RNA methyltransferase [Lachnospiraceae bacterium]
MTELYPGEREAASGRQALPADYVRAIKEQLGDDFDAYIRSMSGEPVRSLMLNTLRGVTKDMLPFELSETSVLWEPDGYYYDMSDGKRPGKHVLHEAGAYYIQEASAMAPARALMEGFVPEEEPYILDLCAAPGGKSTQIGISLKKRGLLVSNEIHPARAQILSRNIERMGIAGAVVTNETPERLSEVFPAFFDGILVDAPCSGEGMFRKNPEAIGEWSAENVEMCAERQAQILECALEMLSPGGRMVYSTCTFSREEDEDMIRSFIEKHGDIKLILEKKLMPHEVNGEGQYYAVMEREGRRSVRPVSAFSVGYEGKGNSNTPPKKKPDKTDQKVADIVRKMLGELLAVSADKVFPAGGTLRRIRDGVYYVPDCVSRLSGSIKILRPGLHAADIKKDRVEPAHALSHMFMPEDVLRTAVLSAEDAAGYLSGLSIPEDRLTITGQVKDKGFNGFMPAVYGGLILGWGKLAGGVYKNHYPKGLRVVL